MIYCCIGNNKKIIEKILKDDNESRKSDNYLYLRVLEQYNRNAKDMTLETWVNEMEKGVLPSFESVRRTRQKIQAERPDLSVKKEK